jgi:hypothetical protein
MRVYLVPRRMAGALMGSLLLLSALHYAGAVSLGALQAALPPLCPFRFLTGIPCPGCGMTGAIFAIIRGDIRAAATYNPFAALLLVLLVLSLAPDNTLRRLPRQVTDAVPYALGVSLLFIGLYWFGWRLLPALR